MAGKKGEKKKVPRNARRRGGSILGEEAGVPRWGQRGDLRVGLNGFRRAPAKGREGWAWWLISLRQTWGKEKRGEYGERNLPPGFLKPGGSAAKCTRRGEGGL